MYYTFFLWNQSLNKYNYQWVPTNLFTYLGKNIRKS